MATDPIPSCASRAIGTGSWAWPRRASVSLTCRRSWPSSACTTGRRRAPSPGGRSSRSGGWCAPGTGRAFPGCSGTRDSGDRCGGGWTGSRLYGDGGEAKQAALETIGGSASLAPRPNARGIELDAASAHPARPPGGDARHEGEVRNVAGDDRTRPHERVGPDRSAADDGAVRPQRGTLLHERPLVRTLAHDRGAGLDAVREYHGRPAEAGV